MTLFHSMNFAPFAQALRLAVVLFLWQGVAIGLLAWIAFLAMRRQSANARYFVGCTAMSISLITFLTTFALFVEVGPNTAIAAAFGTTGAAAKMAASLHGFEPYLPSIAWLWFIGANVMLIRMARQWFFAQQLTYESASAVDERWDAAFTSLCHQLGLARAAKLMRSGIAEMPMVVGWLSPVVLVPISAFTSLTQDQLRSILAHEIAHIRRHDYLVNCLQRIVESILFFHPVVWWISKRIRIEREHCCDDVAVRTAGNALTYATALYRLDGLRAEQPQLALAANGGSLLHRITRIVGVNTSAEHACLGWMPTAILAVGILLTTGLTCIAITSPHGDKATASAKKTAATIWLEQTAEELDARVEAGELSAEDAEVKMFYTKKRIKAKRKGKVYLQEYSEGLNALVKAGELSAVDAEAKMASYKKRIAAESKTEAYLWDVWAKLDTLVKAGEMSAEDAEAKMIALKRNISAKKEPGRKKMAVRKKNELAS